MGRQVPSKWGVRSPFLISCTATIIRRHHGGKGCRGEGAPTPNHIAQGFPQHFCSCPMGASKHVLFPHARVGAWAGALKAPLPWEGGQPDPKSPTLHPQKLLLTGYYSKTMFPRFA